MKIFLLLVFWSLWFLNFSARTVMSPLLPIIEDELAISHAMAGSIFSFLSAGYTISLLLSGFLSPRIGYKRSIVLGFIILMTAVFGLKYASSYPSFAVATFFVGLGTGIYLPSIMPLLTAIFARDNWGKAIAFHETAASFSILSIPLLTAVALSFFQWRALFTILSMACFIVTIFFCIFSPDPRPKKEKKARLSRILLRKDFWIVAILWIFAASNSLGLYNLIPLFLVKEKGMSIEMANTIFGISRIGGFFIVILVGFLVDRYGAKKILFLLLLSTGLTTVGLAITQTIPQLVLMLILQATVCSGFFTVAFVAISKITSFDERSIFTGTTIAIGVIMGLGFTPFALGAIADIWNFQYGILFLGIVTALSCILLKGLGEI
jgi:NNP family nitrate/nitrite transporter-like MFS transporter